MFQPVIKWSGSKRSQASEILKYFPNDIDTYYEPFCGGCSMMRALAESDIKVSNFICSDINGGLIDLWNAIKDRPNDVYEHYKRLWTELNSFYDLDDKKRYFEKVRQRFNEKGDPLDFMFIMRTTTNGMPRYNREGKFNNSFHITRNGIEPSRLRKIIYEWNEIVNDRNVSFLQQSYDEIHPTEKDFIYMDPPYAATKGMYYGAFDNAALLKWMRALKCGYALSYDGYINTLDGNVQEIPSDLYSQHVFIKSGNSSFRRVIGKTKDSIVYESLYLR